MTYTELKEHFHAYRMGRITRTELTCAIFLWQRSRYMREHYGD